MNSRDQYLNDDYPENRNAIPRMRSISNVGNFLDRIVVRKNVPLRKITKEYQRIIRVIWLIIFISRKRHRMEYSQFKWFRVYLRSHSFIPKEIENILGRDWQPNCSGCTKNHAIRLARISALVKIGSYFKLIHPRKRCPLLSIRKVDAGTKIVHHSLGKFHHASFAIRRRNNWKMDIIFCSTTCKLQHNQIDITLKRKRSL